MFSSLNTSLPFAHHRNVKGGFWVEFPTCYSIQNKAKKPFWMNCIRIEIIVFNLKATYIYCGFSSMHCQLKCICKVKSMIEASNPSNKIPLSPNKWFLTLPPTTMRSCVFSNCDSRSVKSTINASSTSFNSVRLLA